jgi:hypothetical protein
MMGNATMARSRIPCPTVAITVTVPSVPSTTSKLLARNCPRLSNTIDATSKALPASVTAINFQSLL